MNRSKASIFQPTITLLILALCLAAVPVSGEDESLPGDCSSIAAWVEEHAADLPRSYETLSEYPMAYRRAIFSTLSAKEKSDLWRTHFQNQLDGKMLNDEQRQILEEARELTSPRLFRSRIDRTTRLRIAAFKKAARNQFDHATARQVFGQLGEEKSEVTVKAITGGTACACNNEDDWCPDGYGCDETAGCDIVRDACGWWWTDDCNGLCEDPSNTM